VRCGGHWGRVIPLQAWQSLVDLSTVARVLRKRARMKHNTPIARKPPPIFTPTGEIDPRWFGALAIWMLAAEPHAVADSTWVPLPNLSRLYRRPGPVCRSQLSVLRSYGIATLHLDLSFSFTLTRPLYPWLCRSGKDFKVQDIARSFSPFVYSKEKIYPVVTANLRPSSKYPGKG
jgi:hypothetical protein